MRWRKLGRIFDPTEHQLANGCEFYAQSPQVLTRGETVRVYFSTRARDGDKYVSHIAYVDLAEDLRQILGVNEQSVIGLGGLGDFDEHGIFPMNVLRVGDEVFGYTCGWNRRVSVSVDTAIGLVTSTDDGTTFVRGGRGPVLGPSIHEPFLVGDGFVLLEDGRFHMWYIFGTSWRRFEPDSAPDRTYKIGYATSSDGVAWQKRHEGQQIIPDALGPDEAQALPTVTRIDGRYHMFFCYRQSSGFRSDPDRGYRIGHAVSDDLSTWTRDDSDPALVGTPGEWDSDMQCYPHVFRWREQVYLLYNGNEFGKYGFGLAVLEQ